MGRLTGEVDWEVNWGSGLEKLTGEAEPYGEGTILWACTADLKTALAQRVIFRSALQT